MDPEVPEEGRATTVVRPVTLLETAPLDPRSRATRAARSDTSRPPAPPPLPVPPKQPFSSRLDSLRAPSFFLSSPSFPHSVTPSFCTCSYVSEGEQGERKRRGTSATFCTAFINF